MAGTDVARRLTGLALVALICAAPASAQSVPAPDAAPSAPLPDPAPAPVAVARPVTRSPTPVASTPRPVLPARTVAPRPAIPAPAVPAAASASVPARAPGAATPAHRQAGARHTRHRTPPRRRPAILGPPSYALPRPVLRFKRLVPAAVRDAVDRATLTAAAGALVVLALSSASLLALTRRLERELGGP